MYRPELTMVNFRSYLFVSGMAVNYGAALLLVKQPLTIPPIQVDRKRLKSNA
jgi:hypothetical protein